MDKLVSQNNNGLKRNLRKVVVEKPTRKQAEKAVRTLICMGRR